LYLVELVYGQGARPTTAGTGEFALSLRRLAEFAVEQSEGLGLLAKLTI